MSSSARLTSASPLAIALGMLAIYIVWGTTYLAIRVVVDPSAGSAIPPFTMVALRFALAGAVMLAIVAVVARPALRSLTRAQIRDQVIVGLALNVGGLGVTSYGEQTIPSGITALLIALLPIWVALIGRVVYKDHIAPLTLFGIVIGIIGVAILISPRTDGAGLDPLGLACILMSPLSWGVGRSGASVAQQHHQISVLRSRSKCSRGALVVRSLLYCSVSLLRSEPRRSDQTSSLRSST